MATTAACWRATPGSISGTGLASAKTMAPSAIAATSSPSMTLGADTPMNTSAPSIASLQRPGQAAPGWWRRRPSAATRAGPGGRGGRRPRRPRRRRRCAPASSSSRRIAVPAAPAPDITIRTSRQVLAHHAQRVGQRGEHHDRGAVLVVVEDRDVEDLAQPALDLEAARRGDVLEVDAGEARARPPGRSRRSRRGPGCRGTAARRRCRRTA